jgi:hypothetical protein
MVVKAPNSLEFSLLKRVLKQGMALYQKDSTEKQLQQ